MPKIAKDPGTVRFLAAVEGPKDGTGWVRFPYSVKELYGVRGYVSVIARLNGLSFRSSIGGWSGQPRVYIPSRVWRRLRKKVGQSVDAAVTLSHESRQASVPFAFQIALWKKPSAWRSFRKLARLRRQEYIQWIDEMGLEAVRKRRIRRATDMLSEGKTLTSGGGA